MKKKLTVAFITFLSLLFLLTALFFIYVSDYYHADAEAVNVLASTTKDNTITSDGKYTIFHSKNDNGTALIFYPGGKVEASAYNPLLKKISQKGITCILVKMPFHLAVFDSSAANNIYKKFPNIKNWYIGGHSLGGAMAGSYMSSHQTQLRGLILLGAYIYGDVSPSKALTIYGSNDQVLNRSKVTYTDNVVVIDGGNHANFGNYGEQKGDGEATITREKQQEIAVETIVDFITRQNQN
jgi:Predicted esterase